MEPLAFRFNRLMRNRYYEILDFINMHYCLTRRTDTAFWREVGRPERVNDRLRAKLEFWRIKPPSASDFVDQFLPGQADGSPGAVDRCRRCPVPHRYGQALESPQLRSHPVRHGLPARRMQ